MRCLILIPLICLAFALPSCGTPEERRQAGLSCAACVGTGLCPHCDDYAKCPDCGGQKVGQCETCDYMGVLHRCAECRSSTKCPACDGSGQG